MKFCFVFAFILSVLSFPASAQVRINGDEGGAIQSYRARYEAIRASGERVVIDGMCFSACTLVIGIVPRDRVCATDTALLGFHAAYRKLDAAGDMKIAAPVETSGLMQTYPGNVRSWISNKGGLNEKMKFLDGRVLFKMVRRCRPEEV